MGVVEDGKVGNAFLKEKFITVVLEKPEYNCSEVIYLLYIMRTKVFAVYPGLLLFNFLVWPVQMFGIWIEIA